ncbi:SDR family oxidoreductase [Burkholderia sp. SIMBA_062]|uniref:SDR family oxidoreductase n=1 Tax=Burkholderia sp. SIMBA_062 TaxID=3085803 RepID=UPI00397B78C8
MRQKILVTGATSTISTAVIELLASADCDIRALVRNASKAGALRALGAELAVGDLEKPRTLNQAFAGIDTVFMLTPPGPRAPEQSSNALWAARQAGVRRIVRLSAFGAAHDAPTINSRLHALSDSELIASGITYTLLKPHFFMQNLLTAAASVAQDGVLPLPLADGKMALIDTRDIARFAARVLMSDGHENKAYTLTGPASISMNEVASAIGGAIRHPVKYVSISLEEALDGMASLGLDEFTLNLLHDYFAAYSRNWGDVVTDDVPRVLGEPAKSIDDFARDYAGSFSNSRTA